MFPTGFGFNFAADEQVLSTSMMSYWGSFAWNGNPNVEGQAGMYMVLLWCSCTVQCVSGSSSRAVWPAHTAANDMMMTMQTPACAAKVDVRADYCAFWDTLGYNFH